MLARQFRLPTTISFQNARVFRTSFMVVRVNPNTLSHNRYGFIVGKKIDKRAVIRNRIKRRTRSVVEKDGLRLKGNDVLFVLTPASKNATFSQLHESVQSLLKKLI